MRIDLHTHTQHSDGLFTVEQLVNTAVARGIKFIALTDHDTMIGVPRFLKLCAAHHLNALPGIEMSTRYKNLELHILALNPHTRLTTLRAHLARQIQKRKIRAQEVVQKLKHAGFTLPRAAEQNLLRLRNIGKPHIARAYVNVAENKKLLTNEFHCQPTINDFIQHILDKPGQVGYAAKERIDVASAIALIHATGAKAVLAHPQFDLPQNPTRKQCCDDLKEMGLDGLEAVNGRRHLEQRADFAKLAAHYGWFMTAGSDTHNTTRLGVNVSVHMYRTLTNIFFA